MDLQRLLVLGGTAWLGRRTAQVAREAGHDVTCLARGESGDVPDGVRLVRADRDDPTAYDGLDGAWDAVIEVSWQPAHVRDALAALDDRVAHWVYVSSVSAYVDPGANDARHAPWSGEGPAAEEDYGPAKVACEDAVLGRAGTATVVRPGLIGGHGDLSDRFGYWVARCARAGAGEPVLVPDPAPAFQVIDVEDLAAFLAHVAVEQVSGAYDAVGDTHTLSRLLATCTETTGVSPDLVPVTDDELLAHGVNPWAGPDSLPLWIPASAGVDLTRDDTPTRAAGLVVRPLAETVAATLRWEREQGLDRPRRSGLSPEAEERVLSGRRRSGSAP